MSFLEDDDLDTGDVLPVNALPQLRNETQSNQPPCPLINTLELALVHKLRLCTQRSENRTLEIDRKADETEIERWAEKAQATALSLLVAPWKSR